MKIITPIFLILLLICGYANAGYILYEKEDITVGSSDVTGWVGYDIANDENVFGIKTSIVEYKGLPLKINLDVGLIGVKEISQENDIDGLFGLSITLPKEVTFKENICLDVGLGYSPDWVTGPNRVIVYAGIKIKF